MLNSWHACLSSADLVAETSFQIFLPFFYWVDSFFIFAGLDFELRASHLLDRRSTTRVMPQPSFYCLNNFFDITKVWTLMKFNLCIFFLWKSFVLYLRTLFA
jgi:hypothetical protein